MQLDRDGGVGCGALLGDSWELPIEYVPDINWKEGQNLLSKIDDLFPPRLSALLHQRTIEAAVIYDNGQTTVWAGATVGLGLKHRDLEWLRAFAAIDSPNDRILSAHRI